MQLAGWQESHLAAGTEIRVKVLKEIGGSFPHVTHVWRQVVKRWCGGRHDVSRTSTQQLCMPFTGQNGVTWSPPAEFSPAERKIYGNKWRLFVRLI